MPAILDRCVMHVMAKGHDKSSAFAICRSSLNLKEDGSDDMKECEMSDEEMEAKISAGYPMNPESTTKIKPMVAAYGGPPPEPQGIPKAATDAPGSGTDTGRTHMPSAAHDPKPGSDKPNPQTDDPSKQTNAETMTPGHLPSKDNVLAGGNPKIVSVPPHPPIGGDARPTVSAEDQPSPAPKSEDDPHQKTKHPPVIHTSDTPQLAQPTLENVPEDRAPGELTKPGSQLGLHPTGVTPAAPRGEGATGPASTSQTNIDEDGAPELAAKVEKRDDATPDAGKSKYGDVTFADETNKKYPIDTEAHIRSAWNYIHKGKNAGKYSAEDVKKIKDKIVSAWKSKIDKAGPPSVEATLAALWDEKQKAATVFFSAPSLAPHVTKQVYVGDTCSFPIEPRNFTGDSVTVKVEPFPLPPNASFDGCTFTFTPEESQIGSYDFVFTASDGIQQLSQSVIVTVDRQPVTKPGKGAGKNAPTIKAGTAALVARYIARGLSAERAAELADSEAHIAAGNNPDQPRVPAGSPEGGEFGEGGGGGGSKKVTQKQIDNARLEAGMKEAQKYTVPHERAYAEAVAKYHAGMGGRFPEPVGQILVGRRADEIAGHISDVQQEAADKLRGTKFGIPQHLRGPKKANQALYNRYLACGLSAERAAELSTPPDSNPDDLHFEPTAVPTFYVGCPASFVVSGCDEDGDPVSINAEDGCIPPWAEYDPDTGVFHGTPTETGSWTCTFILTDGVQEKSQSITVTVLPHEEKAAKAAKAANTMTNTPTLVKDVVVARAGRNFVNGEQEFDLTRENIDEIIANFAVLKKQVPLLLTPDHVFGGKRSSLPAAGWVESMYRNGDDWHARVKFIGEAATLVLNDQFRGVSIGTVMGRDVHGKPVGEALDHLLITNAPFFPDLNIAASASDVGEVRYFTSRGGPKMADPKETVVLDGAVKAAVAAKENEIIALKAANLQLSEQVETLTAALKDSASASEKEAMAKENENLRKTTFAMKIRALVNQGLSAGTLKPAWCDGYAGKTALDTEGSIRWLKSSRFYDATAPDPEKQAFDILKWAVENNQPLYRLNQQHSTGTPSVSPMPKRALSEAEKSSIKAMGLDPDRIAEAPSSAIETFDEWKARKAAKEGK